MVVVDIDERLGAFLVDALLDAFSHYNSCSRCFDIPDLYRRILRCMYSINGTVVFVNIDDKDQYIYLLKKNFSTNFLEVVYYGPV